MKRVKVAVVGATGLVGEYILKLLEERKFPVSELRLYASEKSSGKKISWKRRKLTVENIEDIKDFSPHLTFFATSSEVSKEYVPQLLGKGSFVIDKSRAFRMSKEVPLVVAGGAGPNHACMIALELEIPVMVIPKESSIFCAAGMLMSDLKHDFVRTYPVLLLDADVNKF